MATFELGAADEGKIEEFAGTSSWLFSRPWNYAAEAGFATVDILDVEHPQFRLYRLR